jgi:large subunit ribosomal protein L6
MPVPVPASVEITENGQMLTVKGPKGSLEHTIHEMVELKREDAELNFGARNESSQAKALAGTTRSIVHNMVLNLTLGFSHPIDYELPEGITAETPSQTEIVVKGSDKQQVGQVAAEIRAFRPPEPYKGKGVRYADEIVARKEAKKK